MSAAPELPGLGGVEEIEAVEVPYFVLSAWLTARMVSVPVLDGAT